MLMKSKSNSLPNFYATETVQSTPPDDEEENLASLFNAMNMGTKRRIEHNKDVEPDNKRPNTPELEQRRRPNENKPNQYPDRRTATPRRFLKNNEEQPSRNQPNAMYQPKQYQTDRKDPMFGTRYTPISNRYFNSYPGYQTYSK